MKLLCSESNLEICRDIVHKIASAGIEVELRPHTPSLFDSGQPGDARQLHEIWVLNDEDIDKANAILYPEPEEL